jgi:hypothetical protein
MDENAVCLANIGAAGRRRRLVNGIVATVLATAAGVALARFAGPAWPLLSAIPFFVGWLGILQAAERT